MTTESNRLSNELQVVLAVEEWIIPLLGFNSVKILIINTRNIETFIAALQSDVVNVEPSNIKALVKFLLTSSNNSELMAHSIASDTMIPAGKLVNPQCGIGSGDISTKVPILCETEEIEYQ